MGNFSISGLSSGLDTESILTKLRSAESLRLKTYTNQKSTSQAKSDSWTSFTSKLDNFETKADSLKNIKAEDTKDTTEIKIRDFVTAYNDNMDFMKNQQSYDSENKKVGGILFGNNTLKSIKSTLQNTVYNETNDLKSLGISFDSNNKMVIDDTKLKAQLTDNLDGVKTQLQATDGFANVLKQTSDNISKENGKIYTEQQMLKSNMKGFDIKLERQNSLIDKHMEQYTRSFSIMEDALGRMNNMGSYLSAQLSNLARGV